MSHRFGFPFGRRFSIHGFSQTFTITSSCLYVWVGVKGVYKNFCIYIVRKR